MRRKKRIDLLFKQNDMLFKKAYRLECDNEALFLRMKQIGNVLYNNFECSISTGYTGMELKDQFK